MTICRRGSDGLVVVAAAIFAWPIQAAQWTIETVDIAGAGYFTSLKADRGGNLHAAYVTQTWGNPLKYAFWDRALKRWFTMDVAKNASFCTLVLDSKDHPHISYADFGTGLGCKLQYASWDGSWKVQPIDVIPGGVIGYFTSVALDQKDMPVLTYYVYADPNNTPVVHLGSVFWTGSYWAAMFADRAHGSGKFNSVAIDSTGRPQIAYANVTAETQSLRYATWNGTTWNREIIEGASGPLPVYSVSMVLDKKDVPHIAYTELGHKWIKYATRPKGKWETEIVDSYVSAAQGQGFWDRNGIVLDTQGNPYISYFDKGVGQLKVAHRVNGRWERDVVDGNMSGMTSSLAIADGVLWVSYAALYERSFKVAHRSLEEPANSLSKERTVTSERAARSVPKK
jgi:hypothetical protein